MSTNIEGNLSKFSFQGYYSDNNTKFVFCELILGKGLVFSKYFSFSRVTEFFFSSKTLFAFYMSDINKRFNFFKYLQYVIQDK